MRAVARLNDKTIGECSVHGPNIKGRIITASSSVIVNGRPVARDGDKVKADCGHISRIITNTSKNKVDEKVGTARLNDKVEGPFYKARIITASADFNVSNS